MRSALVVKYGLAILQLCQAECKLSSISFSARVCHKYKPTKFPAAGLCEKASRHFHSNRNSKAKKTWWIFLRNKRCHQPEKYASRLRASSPTPVCPITRLSDGIYSTLAALINGNVSPSSAPLCAASPRAFVLTDRAATYPYIVVIWRRYVTRHACWPAVPVRRRRTSLSPSYLHWRRLDEELWVRRVANAPQKFQFVDWNTLVRIHCVTAGKKYVCLFFKRDFCSKSSMAYFLCKLLSRGDLSN